MCLSFFQTEGTESRSGSSLSLARVRPSAITNGTSKHTTSSSSSGAPPSSSGHKAQRSASTYHRQRRHSDFCKAKYRDQWHSGVYLVLWLVGVGFMNSENGWNSDRNLPHRLSGGPAVPGAAHPKRSPSGVAEGAGLKEERLSIRKPSTNAVGSRSIPTPSSPMVSSAHNPNKAEIPDRRKEVNTTTVRTWGYFVGVISRYRWHNPQSSYPISSDYRTLTQISWRLQTLELNSKTFTYFEMINKLQIHPAGGKD